MNPLMHTVTVNNKKYSYALSPGSKRGVTHFRCDAAKINQEFLSEDIPDLLVDLPKLIVSEKVYEKSQGQVIRFRVSVEDKKAIEKKAVAKGYKSVSSFLRDLALKA